MFLKAVALVALVSACVYPRHRSFLKWSNQPTICWLAVNDWPRTEWLRVRFPTGLLAQKPTPVAARPEARVCSCSLAGISGFESRRKRGCLSLVSVVCCQVEVSVSGWSLVQRSTTECGVSECDHEISTMRRPWPTRGCSHIRKYWQRFSVSPPCLERL